MSEMRLHDPDGNRLNLNAEERAAFLDAARRQPARDRTICETLHWTGCPKHRTPLGGLRPAKTATALHPRRLGFSGLASHLLRDRGVVGEESGSGTHPAFILIGQRCQERRRSPDPIGQRRSGQINFQSPIRTYDDKTGASVPAPDRTARQRGLRKGLTASAGHTRSNNFGDDEPPGNVCELLRCILYSRLPN